MTGVPVSFTRKNPAGAPGAGQVENRHTIGIDARWRSGPFFLEPTVFYQFGTRDTDNPYVPATAGNSVTEARIDAWFVDIIGGWRIGSLLLEGRYMYTTGNRPKDQLNRDVNSTSRWTPTPGYWSGWGEIYGLGIEYYNPPLRGMGGQISFDRFGRHQFAVRATYNVTPELDVRGAGVACVDGTVGGHGWFSCPPRRPPDHRGGPLQHEHHGSGSGLQRRRELHRHRGGARPHLAVRAGPVLTWPAPLLFSGSALDASEVRNGVLTKMESKNIYTVVSRVRYSF